MKTILKALVNPIDLPKLSSLKIQNLDTDTSVNIFLREKNAPDFRSNDQLLASILDKNDTDEGHCLSIWKMLCQYTYNAPPFSEESHQSHDPVQLLTQSGYGYCDDINAALLNLAECIGIPSRMWQLDEHVAPEVYYDGSWHLMDASFQFYCRDATGKIASLEQIHKDPALVQKAWYATGTARLIDLFRQLSSNSGRNDVQDDTYIHLKRYFLEFIGTHDAESDLTLSDKKLADMVTSVQYNRFKNIYKESKKIQISDWWNGHASSHSAEMPLGPGDMVYFYLQELPEDHIMAYLTTGLKGIARGVLEKKLVFGDVENIVWPYPICRIELISASHNPIGEWLISTDNQNWKLMKTNDASSASFDFDPSEQCMAYTVKAKESNMDKRKVTMRIHFSVSTPALAFSLIRQSSLLLYLDPEKNDHTGVELTITDK